MDIRHSTLGVLLLSVAAVVNPAQSAFAQFDEPDTIARFAVGPFVEATFRGSRGTINETRGKLEFSDGPAFGGRAEWRFARTIALGVQASYARSNERFRTGGQGAGTLEGAGLTLINLGGELIFKIKQSVPGFFVLGGGVRFVTPEASETPVGRSDSYSEPIGIIGLGLDAFSRPKFVLGVSGRLYLASTPDQRPPAGGLESTNSLSTDFGLGLSFLYRP